MRTDHRRSVTGCGRGQGECKARSTVCEYSGNSTTRGTAAHACLHTPVELMCDPGPKGNLGRRAWAASATVRHTQAAKRDEVSTLCDWEKWCAHRYQQGGTLPVLLPYHTGRCVRPIGWPYPSHNDHGALVNRTNKRTAQPPFKGARPSTCVAAPPLDSMLSTHRHPALDTRPWWAV